ncbi:hypothetical protein GCM10027445_23480 [Amycolatopsis endophytica]|uniref:DUF3558 domain-containing protein n=1 Tax=Amycolatopsis endophytica TaxID=860233 RepID=A0A853BG32_9PSEU|nr:DUF3558 domain-containing protein [Amycolatopsis endophytica]NYI93612.1 hypothetical protein [Amycolatopsis endophytica]
MTINVRIVQVAAAMAALTMAMTACTTTVSGTASPAPASSTGSADVFANLNACRVLEQLTAGQGFGPGENISRRNECDVLKHEFGTYGLALDPVQGLREYAETTEGVVETSVNGRAALQAPIPLGGCAIVIEVGEHARAMVQVSLISGPHDPQACVDAQALAEKLEPLLPR